MTKKDLWDDLRVLVVWYTDPYYIPPFRLSQNQVTVGVAIAGLNRPDCYDAIMPGPRYDLWESLRQAGISPTFDLIVVWSDATLSNQPYNLDAFDCPKVLCVGDTHHFPTPILNALGYAGAVHYDAIISSHNRHHLHWFAEAGHHNLAWIPGLKAQHVSWPSVERKMGQIAFIGQAGKYHPRRKRLLDALVRADISVLSGLGDRSLGAHAFASSLLSFNASLNGDVNLRLFEVASAGGCLLTDRLHPLSGQDLLFEEGKEIIFYGSSEELIDKAKFCMKNPSVAIGIAKAAHERYCANYMPEMQRDALFNWVFNGDLPDLYNGLYDTRAARVLNDEVLFRQRIGVYETIQEKHRLAEQLQVLFLPSVSSEFAEDAIDLSRIKVAQITNSESVSSSPYIHHVSMDDAVLINWDVVVRRADDDKINLLKNVTLDIHI